MIEELARAIKEGKPYHLFVDGRYDSSYHFPATAQKVRNIVQKNFESSTVQVKYLTRS